MSEKEKLWVIWDGKELLWSGDGREYLRGVGLRYLVHPAFEEGYKKILSNYKPRKKYKLLLILPCSYGKPYSQSYIHYFLLKTIKETGYYDHIHQLIVTNAGIVPRELPLCGLRLESSLRDPRDKGGICKSSYKKT